MNPSDDEINERISRKVAELGVRHDMALGGLMGSTDRACSAIRQMNDALEALEDSIVASMTAEQRSIYNALIACDTPGLDAAAMAEELTP